MQHIKDKNDWLTYEFKPYFFCMIGVAALVLKKNLMLETWQNIVAYTCVGLLFYSAYKILLLRSVYRHATSRK